MTSVPLTVVGLTPADSVSTSVELMTGPNDLVEVSETSGPKAIVAPREVLRSSDGQWLDVSARAGSLGRGASVEFTGTETEFLLAPQLTDFITYEASAASASWTSLPVPSFTSVTYSMWGNSGPTTLFGSFQLASASRRWLELHGSSSVAFDSTAPGYSMAWSIDVAKMFRRNVTVYDDSGSVSYWTSTGDVVNGTTPRRAGRWRRALPERFENMAHR